ncbi:helix-turn-helix domain-containing protein [Chryseobacterium sp. RU33C]|uniref:helix-turn-helix domain-containing protein n=1 Tax=Chryseobacterium sp. RU33C TaxID=1907398 RepID=UPI000953D104|nr:helix-turn-helix transcriptional regulator [Chryseobacterium sp. RU33C]SIQ06525.1 DNA-binding transcriptional regulator, XRE-family HTH domain [Chryseobacterium sp. RU33C]
MENIKQKIGDRIKEVRVEKKLSQEAVAFNAGIERSFMTHIEKGRRNVSIETLKKVLTGLEISFSDFFNSNFFKNV